MREAVVGDPVRVGEGHLGIFVDLLFAKFLYLLRGT